MLALPQKRQHVPHPHPTSTLPSPTSPQQLSFDQLSQQLYNQKFLNDYLESQRTFASDQFMPSPYDFNPTIRVQQSTPVPQSTAGYSRASMLPTNATAGLDTWNACNNLSGNSQSLQTGRMHQRASSASSVASTSTGSQYQNVGQTASYPAFSNVTNHLPTPTHTPTQDSFMGSSNYNNYTPTSTGIDSTMAAHMSMKEQLLMDQHHAEEEAPGFAHSAQQSVSSYGRDSPATPHTAQGDDSDFKVPPNELRPIPKFERTYTEIAADYSFDPNGVSQSQSTPQTKPAANTLLSPWRSSNSNDMVQHRLQLAQMARSRSPSHSGSPGDSPFRQSSPYRRTTDSFGSPRITLGTAAAAREQKVEADAAYAIKPQIQTGDEAEPKTISPKDAMLDFPDDDESKVPLFPDGGASEYDHQYNGGDQYRNATQSTFDTTSGQSYRRDSWTTPQFSQNFPASVAGTSQTSSTFSFATPSIQANLHGLPFATSQYRTASNMPSATESNPEFPAHLTSMESSASEAGAEPGSQSSDRFVKPADSNADSGTYTCTYHGCTQRFETPQKLQKHKREGHRSTAPSMGSSMTSAALLERNSQAGPHKCERINPTTGKPCNTIFSRPYDLTRHEDTIHNARKQKVRCALCVEEKTFSRNDALTRHMRVVHPEVDFPGKHRRRGGNHD